MQNLKSKNQPLFIKTKDLTTFEYLKNTGFELIDYADDVWTFMNDINRPLTFDKKKITYSNILHF